MNQLVVEEKEYISFWNCNFKRKYKREIMIYSNDLIRTKLNIDAVMIIILDAGDSHWFILVLSSWSFSYVMILDAHLLFRVKELDEASYQSRDQSQQQKHYPVFYFAHFQWSYLQD